MHLPKHVRRGTHVCRPVPCASFLVARGAFDAAYPPGEASLMEQLLLTRGPPHCPHRQLLPYHTYACLV